MLAQLQGPLANCHTLTASKVVKLLNQHHDILFSHQFDTYMKQAAQELQSSVESRL
jgi:hypothetical protein